MRSCVVLAVAMTGLAPVASAEPLWTVEAAEIAYLFYGEPGKPVLSLSCGQEEGETGRDETRIEVEVEPRMKPGKDKVVLRVEKENGHRDVPLTPLICGGLSECKNQPDGEVYRYEASVPGKTLALDAFGIAGLSAVIFRQVMSFFNTRNRYMMVLAQNLYFFSLANNYGALTLIADRARRKT